MVLIVEYFHSVMLERAFNFGTDVGASHESRTYQKEGKDGRKLYRKMSDSDSFKERGSSLCEKNGRLYWG